MIRSMTGYGKAEIELDKAKLTIEIKSLNSKQLDLNIRLPHVFNDQELNLRKTISRLLERGKISVFISVENTSTTGNVELNAELIKDYYSQIEEITNEIGVTHNSEIIPAILKMPDIIKSKAENFTKTDILKFNTVVRIAIEKLDEFRIQEGDILEADFRRRIINIMNLLTQVDEFETQRVQKIKERIQLALNTQIDESKIDKNRLEQELIFYIEKLDITEEKLRLSKHCTYFVETLDDNNNSKGKKLGFILQEIGREINTLGSKANDSNLQKIVVQMKDELEKIKEQALNIL